MVSPDTTKWDVTVTDGGILATTAGSSGSPDDFKITRDDLTEVTIKINDEGALVVTNPADGSSTLLPLGLFLQSPNGTAWQVKVNDLDTLYTNDTVSKTNKFNIIDEFDRSLFQIREVEAPEAGGVLVGLVYRNVILKADLPVSPPVIAGSLPTVIVDDAATIKPAIHDGSGWKYYDGSAV